MATAPAGPTDRAAGRLLPAALLLAGLAGAMINACSSSPTSPAAPAEDAGPDAAILDGASDAQDGARSCSLPGVYGSKACMECVGARCCGQITACEGDAPCQLLQKCLLDCLPKPDAGGCYDSCKATFPQGKPLWDPVETCWFGNPDAGGCLIECT
jgi:hypothetical protein